MTKMSRKRNMQLAKSLRKNWLQAHVPVSREYLLELAMLVRKSFQIFFPIIHSISYYWIHQYLETLDEKLQALEKNLTKELEEIKTLLNAILENKRDMQKLAKLYDNYDEGKSDALSPRQSEIDHFNNTLQRTSLLNGLYRSQRFC